jgi:hypothetical protein
MSIRGTVSALLIATALLAAGPATATTEPLPSGRSAVASVHHDKAFMMPNGNIACLFDSGKLRCDILSGLKPEPTKACRFFWKGVMLPAAGRASYLCIIDTIYDPNAPKLHYGSKWKRDGIVCRSRTTGLRCHNPDGHGFLLSRRVSKKW